MDHKKIADIVTSVQQGRIYLGCALSILFLLLIFIFTKETSFGEFVLILLLISFGAWGLTLGLSGFYLKRIPRHGGFTFGAEAMIVSCIIFLLGVFSFGFGILAFVLRLLK